MRLREELERQREAAEDAREAKEKRYRDVKFEAHVAEQVARIKRASAYTLPKEELDECSR